MGCDWDNTGCLLVWCYGQHWVRIKFLLKTIRYLLPCLTCKRWLLLLINRGASSSSIAVWSGECWYSRCGRKKQANRQVFTLLWSRDLQSQANLTLPSGSLVNNSTKRHVLGSDSSTSAAPAVSLPFEATAEGSHCPPSSSSTSPFSGLLFRALQIFITGKHFEISVWGCLWEQSAS